MLSLPRTLADALRAAESLIDVERAIVIAPMREILRGERSLTELREAIPAQLRQGGHILARLGPASSPETRGHGFKRDDHGSYSWLRLAWTEDEELTVRDYADRWMASRGELGATHRPESRCAARACRS